MYCLDYQWMYPIQIVPQGAISEKWMLELISAVNSRVPFMNKGKKRCQLDSGQIYVLCQTQKLQSKKLRAIPGYITGIGCHYLAQLEFDLCSHIKLHPAQHFKLVYEAAKC